MLLQLHKTILTTDIITDYFACDLQACHGACCVEGDAGAPLTLDEVAHIEATLPTIYPSLSPEAQATIDRQGVAYTDQEGDLVTTIIHGRDCAFTTYTTPESHPTLPPHCCICALEQACHQGHTHFPKPISCALYPIREKQFPSDLIGLNLHRWDICRPAFERGRREGIHVYQFLRDPLIRRFGQEWYDELEEVAKEITDPPPALPKGREQ